MESSVSAFAVYTGSVGKLSKKQRLRRNRNSRKGNRIVSNGQVLKKLKNKNNSFIVGENDQVNKEIDNKKLLANNNNVKIKPLKRCLDVNEDNFKNLVVKKKKKMTVNFVGGSLDKTKLNKSKSKETNGKKNKIMKPQKKETSKSIIDKYENQYITKNKELQLGVSRTTEFVGNMHLNQDNRPTLISKINKLKANNAQDVSDRQNISLNCSLTELRNTYSQKLKSSTEVGKEMFAKIIAPFDIDDFFSQFWETAPLYIPSTDRAKFSSLLSTQLIDDYLRNEVVMFSKHIDVTSYKNDVRETHNLEGRALPHVVWDLYNHKCSVRLLSPQSAFVNIFIMNSKLQEYFGCFVGANSYLTPPHSQGFAPHYDDIEALVLQIEGRKHWKIYSPRNQQETLPRYSSKNFKMNEIGTPCMEVTLHPGDVLYFPRGYIHQASTTDSHSLHLTVSMYQKNSWIDLLEKALPLALSVAAEENLELRRGLPLNILRHTGMAYDAGSQRKELIKLIKQKFMKVLDHLDIDQAADLMGVQYMADALPPVLNHEEASRCIIGNGLQMSTNGTVRGSVEFSAETGVRFTTALCHRLIKEKFIAENGTTQTEFRLYYTLDNSREYHGEEPQFLVIPEDFVPAVKRLSTNYPNFTSVKSLPIPTLEAKGRLVGDLWDRGLLMTEKPLEESDIVEDEEEEKTNSENISDIANKNIDDEEEGELEVVEPFEEMPNDDDFSNEEDGDGYQLFEIVCAENGKYILETGNDCDEFSQLTNEDSSDYEESNESE